MPYPTQFGQFPQPMMSPVTVNQQQRLMQMEQMYQPQPQFQPPQMMQQQAPIPGLYSRIVDDINTVAPNEVAADGSPSIFVRRDMGEIYAKRWNQNGAIETTTYKLQPIGESTAEKPNPVELALSSFEDKLKSIDDKLDRALSTKQKPNSNNRKEVEQ